MAQDDDSDRALSAGTWRTRTKKGLQGAFHRLLSMLCAARATVRILLCTVLRVGSGALSARTSPWRTIKALPGQRHQACCQHQSTYSFQSHLCRRASSRCGFLQWQGAPSVAKCRLQISDVICTRSTPTVHGSVLQCGGVLNAEWAIW